MRTSSNLKYHFSSFSSDAKEIYIEFSKSPHTNIFLKNKSSLLENADVVPFNQQSWISNPMQFCLDHYGYVHFYQIILISNNIKTIYEFNKDELNNIIYAPLSNIILSILSFNLA